VLYQDLKVRARKSSSAHAPELLNTQFLPFWLLLIALLRHRLYRHRGPDADRHPRLIRAALTHHRHIAFFAVAAAGGYRCTGFTPGAARIGHRFQTTKSGSMAGRPGEQRLLRVLSNRAQQAMRYASARRSASAPASFVIV